MENDRLGKLKHQRKLLLEHLDWLNQEIDRETIASAPSQTPKTSRLLEAIPPDRPVASSLDPEAASPPQVAADLYQQLGPDTQGAAAQTKRGCLIIGGVLLLAAAALIAYVAFWY